MSGRTAKVLVDFIDVEPAKKVEQSQIKHDNIFGAVGTFATPDITMVQYQKDITNTDRLNKLVAAGDHTVEKEWQASITLLDDDNRALGLYVSRTAKGSETIIQLAGFTPSKTTITKSKVPDQAVITGTPGKLIGGLNVEAAELEFAKSYTHVVGQDLSNVTFDNGTVVVNPPPAVAVGEVAPPVYPVYIKTVKSNKVTFNNLATRELFQCMSFGTSTRGSGIPSEVIVVKST